MSKLLTGIVSTYTQTGTVTEFVGCVTLSSSHEICSLSVRGNGEAREAVPLPELLLTVLCKGGRRAGSLTPMVLWSAASLRGVRTGHHHHTDRVAQQNSAEQPGLEHRAMHSGSVQLGAS